LDADLHPGIPDDVAAMDIEPEYTWLLHRVMRLRTIMRFVKDPQVKAGLRELIGEAEQRLEQLEEKQKRKLSP
jgi:hypothetical protein